MTSQDFLQEFYDARSRLDLEKHLSFAHPDCVFRIVGTEKLGPLTRQRCGLDEIKTLAQELFSTWDMSQVETISSHRCGDTIFVHRRGNVVYRRDGSQLNSEFLDKLTFRDGAIIEYLQFVDTFAVAKFMEEKAA